MDDKGEKRTLLAEGPNRTLDKQLMRGSAAGKEPMWIKE